MNVDLDLKQVLLLLRKRWWIAALVTVLGTSAIVVYGAAFQKPVYQASTKLVINSASDIGGFKLDLNLINSNISLISTYKEIIRTPAIMDRVSSRPELGVTTDELIRKIGFSSVNGTQVVTLTYADHDYRKAALIVNAVSVAFQQEIPNIMKVDNVYLLNEADEGKQPAPYEPNKKLRTAGGFVVFLLIGIGAVLLLDFLDDSLKNETDVANVLGLPTLIVIPKMKTTMRVPPAPSRKPDETQKAG